MFFVPYLGMFSTGVQTFRRDHDRFWVLAAHPNLNLFAAGKKTNEKATKKNPTQCLAGCLKVYSI